MAEAVSTFQNQNAQITKTFFAAFAGMLLAVPIVTVITAGIVKAQFGSIVHAQAAQPAAQVNTVAAGPSCEAPIVSDADTSKAGAQANHATAPKVSWRGFPVSQSNSTTNTTTTNTTNNSVDSRFSGNTLALTDNRFSGNTYTDNRFSGNTNNTNVNSNNTTTTNTTVNATVTTDSNNSYTETTTTNNVNTNVNSNNTIVNDNDLVDVL